MTDPHGVCAKRAEALEPGVPYVRGWSDGRDGAEALADQIRAVGLAEAFTGLKADVNVKGEGVVCLGAIRPEVALRLSGLLAAGLAVEMMNQWADDARAEVTAARRGDE